MSKRITTTTLPYMTLVMKPMADLMDVYGVNSGLICEESQKMAELELVRRVVIMKERNQQFESTNLYYRAMDVLYENHVPTDGFYMLNPEFGD